MAAEGKRLRHLRQPQYFFSFYLSNTTLSFDCQNLVSVTNF